MKSGQELPDATYDGAGRRPTPVRESKDRKNRSNFKKRSNLPRPRRRDRVARIPRRVGGQPRARDEHVEQIWATAARLRDGALHGGPEFVGARDALAADAVGGGQVRELNVRAAEVADHVLAFLARAPALHQDVVARLVVAAVVADDGDDGHVVAGHGPERVRLPEEEAAVALERDHLTVGQRELHPD